jgi:hypothetical protein
MSTDAQGKDAPGGAYDYLAHGRLIGGFAMVAYPAQYGVSGIMTFIVNHEGIVYEKDLGPNGAAIARAMKEFQSGQHMEAGLSAALRDPHPGRRDGRAV